MAQAKVSEKVSAEQESGHDGASEASQETLDALLWANSGLEFVLPH